MNLTLLLLGVIDALLAPTLDEVVISRSMSPVVVMGASAPLSWTVTNRGRRTLRFALADSLAPSLHPRTRRVHGTAAPSSTVTMSTVITPSRRGRFDITEVALRIKGPLGLMYRERRRDVPAVLRVHPPFKSKDEAELRIRRARILEVGLRSARGLGGGTEFEQLREYTADDEFRHVDWSASARAGKTIVRTYRPERNQNVMVLVDNGRLMAAQVGEVPRLEHAMDATIMLTAVATRLGDKVGLVTFDQQVRTTVAPANHREQVTRITEAMYALEPVLAESDYSQVFRYTLSRFRKRSLLVLLTDLVEQAFHESLMPALPLILRHHIVLIGAVRDPDVVTWSSSAPDTSAGVSEIYRKAASIESIDERERLVASLRGMGATVVDAAPGTLAPQLADVYLKLKSTGRL